MPSLNNPINTPIAEEARNEATMAHLAGALLLFAGPFAIWLLKRAPSAFGSKALMESLNWQMFVTGSVVLLAVVMGVHYCGYLMLINAAYAVYGAFTSSRGIDFKYGIPCRMFS